jgi:hypothetical protein
MDYRRGFAPLTSQTRNYLFPNFAAVGVFVPLGGGAIGLVRSDRSLGDGLMSN